MIFDILVYVGGIASCVYILRTDRGPGVCKSASADSFLYQTFIALLILFISDLWIPLHLGEQLRAFIMGSMDTGPAKIGVVALLLFMIFSAYVVKYGTKRLSGFALVLIGCGKAVLSYIVGVASLITAASVEAGFYEIVTVGGLPWFHIVVVACVPFFIIHAYNYEQFFDCPTEVPNKAKPLSLPPSN